jgi:hypothetical protein
MILSGKYLKKWYLLPLKGSPPCTFAACRKDERTLCVYRF